MVAFDNLAALGQRRIARLRLAFGQLALPRFAVPRALPSSSVSDGTAWVLSVLKWFTLPGWIALAAVLLVMGTIALHGFSGNAWRLGSRMGWRFASLVFFAALAGAPVGRLAGRFWPGARVLEDRSPELIWGFCASYGVYLLAVLVPNGVHLAGGALLFVLFGAGVTAVMAAAAAPLRLIHGAAPLIEDKVRRALLGTAMTYFWLAYCLLALARIAGPHRPGYFHGTSLLLMILALLLRFAGRWAAPMDGGRPAR